MNRSSKATSRQRGERKEQAPGGGKPWNGTKTRREGDFGENGVQEHHLNRSQ